MPFSAIPKALIVYSSPGSFDRLRLDKEHRAIEEVLKEHQLPEGIIRRIHAATLVDVGAALGERDYEVVMFSCHGDQHGLFLEEATSAISTPWLLLAKTLGNAAPSLSVVVANACDSSGGLQALHGAASFVIVVEGSADDEAAIAFSQSFFREFYRSNSVEHAFRHASSTLEQLGLTDKIKPVLSRRQRADHSVIQACFSRRQDSIFVDVADAEPSISRLPISRHAFLSLLTRKIRIHSWIFKVERERAVLPIGQFFGIFSWRNPSDLVVLHEVLQLKPQLNVDECMAWTRLMIIYNDLRSERYRIIPDPAARENRALLIEAINGIDVCYQDALLGEEVAMAAKNLAPIQYSVTISTVRTQCELAKRHLQKDDLSRVVIALETAISSLHDLVDELTASVVT